MGVAVWKYILSGWEWMEIFYESVRWVDIFHG